VFTNLGHSDNSLGVAYDFYKLPAFHNCDLCIATHVPQYTEAFEDSYPSDLLRKYFYWYGIRRDGSLKNIPTILKTFQYDGKNASLVIVALIIKHTLTLCDEKAVM